MKLLGLLGILLWLGTLLTERGGEETRVSLAAFEEWTVQVDSKSTAWGALNGESCDGSEGPAGSISLLACVFGGVSLIAVLVLEASPRPALALVNETRHGAWHLSQGPPLGV